MEDERKSRLEQASSSAPKVKKQTVKESPAIEAQNPFVYGGQDEKDRHVILDIIPYVVVTSTSLETDAFMDIVAYFDMLTVEGNPARVRKKKKEGTQGRVAILK